MFIKTTVSQGYKYLQIIHSYRKEGKVKHKVIANLGRADAIAQSSLENIINSLRKYLDKENSQYKDISKMKETKRVNYGYIAYKKLWKEFNLDEILGDLIKRRKIEYNFKDLIFSLVANRLLFPSSKHGFYTDRDKIFEYDKDLQLREVYASLDILSENKDKIESELFHNNRDLFNMEVDVVFYDVTTYHFESQKADAKRDFGFSKANKVNEVQVVMGLLIDREGRPIGYELFPGNTFDGKTMVKFLKKLKNKFKLNQVIIVADKAMNSKINLKDIKEQGFDYIVSSRIKNLPKKIQQQILSEEGYQDLAGEEKDHIYNYKVIDYDNKVIYEEGKEKKQITLKEKMVCSYSSKRAEKDKQDRQRAIEKAEAIIEEQDHSKIKTKRGYKKYVAEKTNQQTGATPLELDKERIAKEAQYDGYFALQYSREDLSAKEVIRQYHNLYKIEESFRVLKSTMKTRPIFLRTEEHIEGHFIICFIAFMLQRELEFRLRRKSIEYSSDKIKESLSNLEFSQLEIENTPYYLKGEQNKVASDIFALLRIKHPKNLMTTQEAEKYVASP